LFDLLKKKLGNFAEKVKQTLDQKEQAEKPTVSQIEEKPAIEEPVEAPVQKEEPVSKEEPAKEEQAEEIEEPVLEETAKEELIVEEPESRELKAIEETIVPEETDPKPIKEEPAIEKPVLKEPEPIEAPIIEEEPVPKPVEIVPEKEEKRELKPRLGIRGKLKAAITGSVKLEEKDLKGLMWEFELALLEADVEQTTSEEICREIKKRLVEKPLQRGKSVEDAVKEEIKNILLDMMKTEEIDLLESIKAKKDKPFKILLLGPNGAGKTTSLAKLTHLLQKNKLKVIWAAGDTFRAASIEQLEKHAEKLGVRVVKHQYGADPAAVAFDAVKAGQSQKLDVVLIDSAGRQETNKNLMGELQKIVRVVQPDLKIYVGEAFTGQSLLQQAKEYNKIVGIDGFILTKIDCDSKGGTTISLLYKMGKPILFVGTGQDYKDIQKFKPEFILERIIG